MAVKFDYILNRLRLADTGGSGPSGTTPSNHYTFNTVAAQAAYTVPAGMTIVGVLMSGSVVGSNAYTYAGTTFTFSQAPDDIYPVTIEC